MGKKKFEELPEFIQKRILEMKKFEGKELTFPLTEPIDIWKYDAERLFPNSPKLQKMFNEVKEYELKKRKNL